MKRSIDYEYRFTEHDHRCAEHDHDLGREKVEKPILLSMDVVSACNVGV